MKVTRRCSLPTMTTQQRPPLLALLLTFFFLSRTITNAKQFVPHGQCYLRIPQEFTTTSPIDLPTTSNNNPHQPKRPRLVTIGHRGSSYNLPEHTLPGYRLALDLGADYIEPDLVATKDKVLVAVHSMDLNITTDVAEKFPTRFRNLTSTNAGKEGWTMGYFVQDFTLEEIGTLRVRQRVEDTVARSRYLDWHFGVPTFTEIIDLLYDWNVNVRPIIGTDKSKVTGRPGLYVELKHNALFEEDVDIDLVELLVEELKSHPLAGELFFGQVVNNSTTTDEEGGEGDGTNTTIPSTIFGCESNSDYQVPPLVLQSFESNVLERLSEIFNEDKGEHFNGSHPPLVLLVTRTHCAEPGFWYGISRMQISGIGPDKSCLIPPPDDNNSNANKNNNMNSNSNTNRGKEFMLHAKENKLAVHPWTERLEHDFLGSPSQFQNAEEELRHMYCELGIHGIFAENVDVAVRVGIRGCDDFKSPEELIEEEITLEEEEEENTSDGSGETLDEKKICNSSKGNNKSKASFGLACMAIGLLAGALLSFIITTHLYRKRSHVRDGTIKGSAMSSVPTIADGTEREIL